MKYHCRPDGTSVVMGIVDDQHVTGSIPEPKEHIFLAEKVGWWDFTQRDGFARHDGFNESFQARLRAWNTAGCPRRADVGNELSN